MWVLVELYKNKKIHIQDVQPIRSKEDIEKMRWALGRFCGQRDLILFNLGLATGLRCGDMLRLKAKDVKNKKEVKVFEGKTKKQRLIYLHSIYEELNEYINTLQSPWLFPSRKGKKPITVTQAYRQMKLASSMAEIEHIGTHTMRKTFGYWHYKQFKNIGQLQTIFNHSSQDITLAYIGITEEDIEENMKEFKI